MATVQRTTIPIAKVGAAPAASPWAPARDGEPLATSRQVAFALDLLERHERPLLHGYLPKPTRQEVVALSRPDCSRLISLLKVELEAADRHDRGRPLLTRETLEAREARLEREMEDFEARLDEDLWHLSDKQVKAFRRAKRQELAAVQRQLVQLPNAE